MLSPSHCPHRFLSNLEEKGSWSSSVSHGVVLYALEEDTANVQSSKDQEQPQPSLHVKRTGKTNQKLPLPSTTPRVRGRKAGDQHLGRATYRAGEWQLLKL